MSAGGVGWMFGVLGAAVAGAAIGAWLATRRERVAARRREQREEREEQQREHELIEESDDRPEVQTIVLGGLAHDINNPLAAMLMNLELIAHLARDQPRVAASAGDAVTCAERIRGIVADVGLLAGSDRTSRTPIALAAMVEAAVRLAAVELARRARVVIAIADAPPVIGNPARIGQLILSMVIDAAHTLAESAVDTNRLRVALGGDAEGRAVLEIAAVGACRGSGPSLGQRAAAAIGGTLEIERDGDRGVIVRLRLPPAPAEAIAAAAASPRTTARRPAVRRGRVLVIDDEPLIGSAVRRILHTEHDVVTVTSGADALDQIARAQTAQSRFDVILCDLTMPDMAGLELVRRLDPEIAARVVFVSAATGPTGAELDGLPNQRLDKPFDVDHLRALVRERLSH